MCGHEPNLIAIDMNDYNRLKSSSSYLNATQIQMLCFLHEGIEQFKQVVKEFKTEGAHQVTIRMLISSTRNTYKLKRNILNTATRFVYYLKICRA